jgi:hypothetical protein
VQVQLPAISHPTALQDPRKLAYRSSYSQLNLITAHNSYLRIYDLYGPERNAYDASKSSTRASGRGWTLHIEIFLGPVKWHRDRRVPFGAQKNLRFPGPNPLPLDQVMDLLASKALRTGPVPRRLFIPALQ